MRVVLPETQGLRASGVELAVHDWGGAGAPVLLAHATGFHGRIWEPVAARLVAAGRHVWSFDFRGHGDSSAPTLAEDDYAWSHFAEDALAVARHLKIAGADDALVCGHSKGGTALLLGERAEPGTFARIWTYEPIIFSGAALDQPADDFPLARRARKRRNAWPNVDEAIAAYSSKPPLDVMTAEALRAYVEYGLRDRGDGVLELKCRPEVEARVYAMAPLNGAWDALPYIEATVAVASGAESQDVDRDGALRVANRLPHGHVEVFAGLGHFGPQQDPDAIVASMLAFASD